LKFNGILEGVFKMFLQCHGGRGWEGRGGLKTFWSGKKKFLFPTYNLKMVNGF
jgi:hypothetical protein